jgi:hypothetical protein
MSISGISTTSPTDVFTALLLQRKQDAAADAAVATAATAPTGTRDSFKSDFASILSAVKAGDIGGAQSALTKLTGDFPGTGASYSPSSTAPASAPQTDLQSMIQAVQSGDISGAQTALASLKTDAQSAAATGGPQQAHHHHHHHAAAAPTAPAPTDTSSSTNADPGADQSTSQPIAT